MDINKIVVTGRLTRDPNSGANDKGRAWLSFDIATNTGYGDGERTNFLRVFLGGNYAKGLAEKSVLSKGTDVTVEGQLRSQTREITVGDETKKVSQYYIDASAGGNVRVNRFKSRPQGADAPAEAMAGDPAPVAAGEAPADGVDESDVPF